MVDVTDADHVALKVIEAFLEAGERQKAVTALRRYRSKCEVGYRIAGERAGLEKAANRLRFDGYTTPAEIVRNLTPGDRDEATGQ